MKTGFFEHLFASLALSVAVFLVFPQIGFLPPILFILGSAVPDIDHPKSIPRRFLRAFLFIALFAVSAFSFWSYQYSGSGQVLGSAILAFLLAGAGTFLIERIIPRHRGAVHSVFAGFIFGAVVFMLAYALSSLQNALLLGLSAWAGFAFHLLVDFFGDRV